MAVTSGLSADDLLGLDVKKLSGLASSFTSTISSSLNQITQRPGPQNLSRTAASSNTFVTTSAVPIVTSASYEVTTEELGDLSQTDMDRISEIAKNNYLQTEADFGTAKQSVVDYLSDKSAVGISGDLNNVSAASSESSGFTEDVFGTFSLPSDTDLTGSLNDIDIPSLDMKSIGQSLSRVGDDIQASEFVGSIKAGYATVTDAVGNAIDGIPTDIAYSTMSSISSLASSLCNVRLDELFDFSTNKNLFNILLSSVLGNGVSGLLSSLLGCAQFADNMSKKQVSDFMPTLASNGDVDSMTAAFQGLGSGSISNMDYSLRTLSRNATYSDKNVTGIDDLIKTNSSYNKVFGGNTVLGNGYKTSYISGTSASNQSLLSKLLGEDTVGTANALNSVW